MKELYRIGGKDWKIGQKKYCIVDGKKVKLIFRGFLSDGFSGEGIYYDERKKNWTYLDNEVDPDLIKATKTIPNKRKKSANHIKTSIPVSEKISTRIDPNKVFRIELHEEDDEMVQVIKEAINIRELTFSQISSHPHYSYNLLYGLKTRKSIKFSSFKKWAKILNLKIIIQLLPKEKI